MREEKNQIKDQLVLIIKQIISLLHSCGMEEQADWFKEKLGVIEKQNVNSRKFKSELKEIRKIIAGIGSFSDLSLIPEPKASITKEQAKHRQWELANDLDEAIAKLLK